MRVLTASNRPDTDYAAFSAFFGGIIKYRCPA